MTTVVPLHRCSAIHASDAYEILRLTSGIVPGIVPENALVSQEHRQNLALLRERFPVPEDSS